MYGEEDELSTLLFSSDAHMRADEMSQKQNKTKQTNKQQVALDNTYPSECLHVMSKRINFQPGSSYFGTAVPNEVFECTAAKLHSGVRPQRTRSQYISYRMSSVRNSATECILLCGNKHCKESFVVR